MSFFSEFFEYFPPKKATTGCADLIIKAIECKSERDRYNAPWINFLNMGLKNAFCNRLDLVKHAELDLEDASAAGYDDVVHTLEQILTEKFENLINVTQIDSGRKLFYLESTLLNTFLKNKTFEKV